jgi:hypothetical protein
MTLAPSSLEIHFRKTIAVRQIISRRKATIALSLPNNSGRGLGVEVERKPFHCYPIKNRLRVLHSPLFTCGKKIYFHNLLIFNILILQLPKISINNNKKTINQATGDRRQAIGDSLERQILHKATLALSLPNNSGRGLGVEVKLKEPHCSSLKIPLYALHSPFFISTIFFYFHNLLIFNILILQFFKISINNNEKVVSRQSCPKGFHSGGRQSSGNADSAQMQV